MEYVPEREDDPFVLAEPPDAVDETRLTIMLVNKRWNAVAQIRVRCEIRMGWRPRSEDFTAQDHLVKKGLQSLVRVSQSAPHLLKNTRTMVILLGPEHVEDYRVGAQVCHLLSYTTLHHFSTNLDFEVPWLLFLSMRSAHTLTHLDSFFNPLIVPDSMIQSLNSFPNLVFLRMADHELYDIARITPHPQSLVSLPRLSLPKLREMHVVARSYINNVHPNGHIPFHVGATADLPSLTRLYVYQEDAPDDIWELFPRFLRAFGRTLEVFHFTDVFIPSDLEDLAERAPNLTELGVFVTDKGDYHGDVIECIQHPRLQHLAVTGRGHFTDTLRLLDKAKLPALVDVRFAGVVWDPNCTPDWLAKEMEDIEMAGLLTLRGILCVDEDGKPFGNLKSLLPQQSLA
ncbi:hypothetical protein PUNSTDRAFT_133633 [Punctularia strigosozonata HHB-11173 SS5]|uniref:uncharacterized protein n=1 Tax=Punctularia strigosozonata (strain HHB-11173) TaxID=741275 RepID=UPI000441689F|nr:uncharacterized protein PUNSTDRAFT_133633 [Punctularia strigosozonata HHB-11173 SS5]EIN09861.1 hypothetical protein PUNSTDRAFT_133633 [Punctularia strigosozonata HHB-11173 SS5]